MNDQTEPRPVESEHAIAGKIVAGMKRFVDSRTMSSDTETIADIVRELRKFAYSNGGKPRTWIERISVRQWHAILDKIEAAAKRERERAESSRDTRDAMRYAEYAMRDRPTFVGVDLAKPEKNSGNSAALREALERFVVLFDRGEDVTPDEAYSCANKARAALAAPPRNCDRFQTIDEARNAYWAYREPLEFAEKDFLSILDWLFAPAEGDAK